MMHQAEGRPPVPVDENRRKYVLDKLSEIRKSCEWLLTLGAGSIFANLLKGTTGSQCLRESTLLVVSAEMFLALLGATAWLSTDVEPSEVDQSLMRTLYWRYAIRNVALVLLVIAFVMLSFQVW